MNNVSIEFKNVTKIYKLYKNEKERFKAVFTHKIKCKEKIAGNNLNFKIEKGETVAFFGENGAGKSTILKIITGVTYPTRGSVIVNGRVSALLELTAGFDPEFTGRENIFLRGELLGMRKRQILRIEKKVIEFADIGDYIDQPVRTYSSGMKARLGFAINANLEPDILIVDEALSVGDRAFRRKCTEKVKELITNNNITFLFVTHSTGAALEFCTRGIVLKNGTIKFDGNIEEASKFYNNMMEKNNSV